MASRGNGAGFSPPLTLDHALAAAISHAAPCPVCVTGRWVSVSRTRDWAFCPDCGSTCHGAALAAFVDVSRATG